MPSRFLKMIVLSGVMLTVSISTAFAAKRVALIIGNNDYSFKTLPDLKNAKKDAQDMARKLKHLGFEVILKINAGRREMNRAIDEFSGRLSGGDTALVFYAGHGIQAGGKNYLIPVDGQVEYENDLRSEAMVADDFLTAMADANVGLSMLILDACRNNPLPKSKRSSNARGLAVVQVPTNAAGSAVLYSAGPGQTAEDGPQGGNGVFTGALLKALDKPGLKLEDVFKQTVKIVLRKTNNRQRPFMNASLDGDFYFKKGTARPSAAAVSGGANMDLEFWNGVKDSNDATMFEAYLEQYPDGGFAALARARVKKLSGPSFDVASLDTKMYAQKTSNVRSGPDAKASKVGSLTGGSSVDVTGQTRVNGSIWYRVALSDGGLGYVFGKLLGDRPKPVQQASIPIVRQPSPPSHVRRTGGGTNAGVTFRDCADCPEMVRIPAGSFQMGSNSGYDDEKPVHRVNINYSFAVGKYEVTQRQWRAVMGGNPSRFSGDDKPVERVSWNDVKEFIRNLNAKTGQRYRLLSESEWEYAARAGTSTKYSWGNSIGNNNANCDGCGSRWDKSKTSPVGSFRPNAFGLYDMHGNVWEWVEDCYEKSYRGAPTDGSASTGNNSCNRVFRGGSGLNLSRGLRSANRSRYTPVLQNDYLGFRLARTL